MKNIVGIIGGLGPSATVDLYKRITKNTQAAKDQDHLRIIIDSHPQIPDRTEAILNGGPSPVPYLQESLDLLESSGARVIAVPCVTAHYFLPELAPGPETRILDMIRETALELQRLNITEVGILSTSGTAKSGIFDERLKRHGINGVIPDEIGLNRQMEAIYGPEGIKAGAQFEKSPQNKAAFLEIIEQFRSQGIFQVIMGCTEIPLCLDQNDTESMLINPVEVLAQAVVREAKVIQQRKEMPQTTGVGQMMH